jgi:hypothetical protein
MLSSWRQDQSYHWRLAPLQLSAQSHVLITINRCCRSLQYDIRLLTIAFSVMAVIDILYHRRFGAFAIIVVNLTIKLKKLVVAWHDLVFPSRNQPCCARPRHKNNVILIVASCNMRSLQ